jgi:hypothetical protein
MGNEVSKVRANVTDLYLSVCFGPPGSGFDNQRYGSGSFPHHATIERKTMIPIVLRLLSLKNEINISSKSSK